MLKSKRNEMIVLKKSYGLRKGRITSSRESISESSASVNYPNVHSNENIFQKKKKIHKAEFKTKVGLCKTSRKIKQRIL